MIAVVEAQSEPQFIYPPNPTLRKAYQALVAKVLEERAVVFRPASLTQAIIEGLGWIDDGNLSNPDRPEGPNYKKAKNILRTFEGKFTKFNRGGLEIFVFKTDKTRVATFEELEGLCSLDPHMSEIVATVEKLDLSQTWRDVLVNDCSIRTPVSDSLARIDAESTSRRATVIKMADRAKTRRLVGKKKGFELPKEQLNEVKMFDVINEREIGDL